MNDWSATEGIGGSADRMSGAELHWPIVVGNELHARTQEVIDDAGKIRARQSAIVRKSPPWVVPLIEIVDHIISRRKKRNDIVYGFGKASGHRMTVEQLSSPTPPIL